MLENVETVLAVELLAACQGLDYVHKKSKLVSTPPVEAVLARVRKEVEYWSQDRYMSPDILKALELIRSGEVLTIAHANL